MVPCQLPLETSVSPKVYQAEHLCRGCLLARTRLADFAPCYGPNHMLGTTNQLTGSDQRNVSTSRITYGSNRVKDVLARHAVTSGGYNALTHLLCLPIISSQSTHYNDTPHQPTPYPPTTSVGLRPLTLKDPLIIQTTSVGADIRTSVMHSFLRDCMPEPGYQYNTLSIRTSTHTINPSSQHILSIHPLNTPTSRFSCISCRLGREDGGYLCQQQQQQ